MNQFEIFSWHPPHWNEPHPAVIVSHPNRAEGKDMVEVLMCSTLRKARAPKENEFLLDQADGLDWTTVCKCDLIFAVPREDLKQRRGQVSLARRAPIIRKVLSAHQWGEVLAGA
jgi:mRNA-degrading endonuclease toxin of MazEF toxin-antitoxin module